MKNLQFIIKDRIKGLRKAESEMLRHLNDSTNLRIDLIINYGHTFKNISNTIAELELILNQ